MIEKYFSKSHLFYLAVLAFGASFAFTFQLSNLSSIFKFLGAEAHQLPFLWLAAPITGLIIQPLIGQISDDTITKYGKRRPFIIGWGILGAFSFAFLPLFNSLLYAVILTWIIDASLNGVSETLRALTSDLSIKQERSKAFALQAFFGGIGAAFGTSLPYIVHKTQILFSGSPKIINGAVPLNLKISFILTGCIIGIVVFISMRNVKEKPYNHEKLLALKHKLKHFTKSQVILKTFRDLWGSLNKSPPNFKKYCFIHATTWLGIFIFWLYFTTVLAQNLYHLPVIRHSHNPPPQYANLLQEATLASSLYLTIYQYVSVAYTLILFFVLAKTEKTKFIHGLSLVIGGLGMSLICFVHTKILIIVSMIAIGIMWGSISVLPYTIISQLLPKGKLGTYLGIFNISITIPQIVSGLLLSPLYIYVFKGQAGYLLLVAGILIMISASLWIREALTSKEISSKIFIKPDIISQEN